MVFPNRRSPLAEITMFILPLLALKEIYRSKYVVLSFLLFKSLWKHIGWPLF